MTLDNVLQPAPAERAASVAIAEELRRRIVRFELAPGSTVSEAQLMDLLQCGRAPLREALRMLAQEYLVQTLPRVGIQVTGLTVLDFGELYESWAPTEALGLQLAAQRATPEQLRELEDIISRMETAAHNGNGPAAADCDLEFHGALARATGNRYVADSMMRLDNLMARFARLVYMRSSRKEEAAHDHRGMLEALRSRDPAELQRAAREAAENSRTRVVGLLLDPGLRTLFTGGR